MHKLIAELERKFRDNQSIEDFIELLDSEFRIRKIEVQCMIRREAKDLALFDDYREKPEYYIIKAIYNCRGWTELPRKEIKSGDLCTYGIAYLFFRSIERKTKYDK